MTQTTNPYLPPSNDLDKATNLQGLKHASRKRRFGTLLVDYVGGTLLSALIGLVVGFTLGETGTSALEEIPDVLLGLIIFFVYYVFFEAIWARTPGKWLFGTVVVDEEGAKPSIGQVLGRTACRFIPFEALSFFGSAGWHDRIPKTRVVRVS